MYSRRGTRLMNPKNPFIQVCASYIKLEVFLFLSSSLPHCKAPNSKVPKAINFANTHSGKSAVLT